MERIPIKKIKENIGKEVKIAGWVDTRRDMGKLIFIDVRDASGKIQTVCLPNNKESNEVASTLKNEWVVEIVGNVKKRPERMINKQIENGDVEMEIKSIIVINKSETPPFAINEDTIKINEDLRLKYRYLDLRSERMHKNIIERDRVISFIRDYLHKNDFVEIETPILMKGTPEGSREYLVPSRLEKGKFYALPQSPQQFKQLCMVAGFERYFQIARCFRDEDTRGDRQPEFTQLDIEMSFVKQEDILSLTEKMMIDLIEKLYPNKKITQKPFPRITFEESVKKFGNDKPDMRNNKEDLDEISLVWVTDFPMFEKNSEGGISASHHPFCSIKEEDVEKFKKGEDLFSIRANAYDLVVNGYELCSGSIRIHESDVQKKVFDLLKISEEEQNKKFGHMLEAFKFGAPPHGGLAPGIDRLMMILMNEPNIREVIPFAKTGEGKDLLMSSPSEASQEQLKELGIVIK